MSRKGAIMTSPLLTAPVCALEAVDGNGYSQKWRCKKIKILVAAIFCFSCTLSTAQTEFDSIEFGDIFLNNKSLYTKFNHLKNILSDKDNRAKAYPSKDINIPFVEFNANEVVYNVASEHIVYNYSEERPNDIFVTYVKPSKNFKISLGGNLFLRKGINVSSLKIAYPKSYNMHLTHPENNFRLVVKKNHQSAFLDLVFKDNLFQEMYLTTQ